MVVQDWVSVIVNSLQDLWAGAVGVLGSIIGALIVFLIGLIVASGISKLIEKVVSFVKLDTLIKSLGIEEYFERAGLSVNSGKFFGKIAYWFLVIVFLLAASDILGFFTLSEFLRDVLLYIPNVIIAVLIMLASMILASFLRELVRSTVKGAQVRGYKFLGSLTWWAITIFGLLTALAQLGVAREIITTVIGGFIAMFALAGGLAFGLGGKEYASYLVSRLREYHDE